MRMPEELLDVCRRQLGLFERGQALLNGLDDDVLDRAVRARQLERLHWGVYRLPGEPLRWDQRLLGACLGAGEGSAVSHRSGAAFWSMAGPTSIVEITVPRPRQPRLKGVVVRRSTDLRPSDITIERSVPVTMPARTLLDLGAVAPRWVVADALERGLAARLLTPPRADAILDDLGRKGRRGTGALRAVLDDRALGHGIPDGLLEPRMARVLRDAVLPTPAFQYEMRDRRGRVVARIDFAWPDRRLAVEVDGFAVHGSPKAMTADLARQNYLVGLGWTVLRFTWDQVVRRPGEVVATLKPFLAQKSA